MKHLNPVFIHSIARKFPFGDCNQQNLPACPGKKYPCHHPAPISRTIRCPTSTIQNKQQKTPFIIGISCCSFFRFSLLLYSPEFFNQRLFHYLTISISSFSDFFSLASSSFLCCQFFAFCFSAACFLACCLPGHRLPTVSFSAVSFPRSLAYFFAALFRPYQTITPT